MKRHMHIWQQVLAGIIALLILNYSIDVQDAVAPHQLSMQADGCTEDLSYNDIESVYELVTECWMDMEDHVPENDDDDNNDKSGKHHTYWLVSFHYPQVVPVTQASDRPFCFIRAAALQGYIFSDSPPPDSIV